MAVSVATAVLALAGCADLEEALNGPSREKMSVPVYLATNAPPPPASLLGLAQPPRPRPRVPTSRSGGPGQPSLDGAAADGLGADLGTPEVVAAAAAPGRSAAPAAPAVGAERVLGLSEASLEVWLGPPQQRLDIAPARVWRYVEQNCRLDAFLYLDMQTREFHVLHYEVATNDDSEHRTNDCVRKILVRNGGPLPRPGPVQAENRPH